MKKEFIKTLHNLQTQKNNPIIEAIKHAYRICYESTEIIKTPIKVSIRKKYENLGTDDNIQTGNINGDLSFDEKINEEPTFFGFYINSDNDDKNKFLIATVKQPNFEGTFDDEFEFSFYNDTMECDENDKNNENYKTLVSIMKNTFKAYDNKDIEIINITFTEQDLT